MADIDEHADPRDPRAQQHGNRDAARTSRGGPTYQGPLASLDDHQLRRALSDDPEREITAAHAELHEHDADRANRD